MNPDSALAPKGRFILAHVCRLSSWNFYFRGKIFRSFIIHGQSPAREVQGTHLPDKGHGRFVSQRLEVGFAQHGREFGEFAERGGVGFGAVVEVVAHEKMPGVYGQFARQGHDAEVVDFAPAHQATRPFVNGQFAVAVRALGAFDQQRLEVVPAKTADVFGPGVFAGAADRGVEAEATDEFFGGPETIISFQTPEACSKNNRQWSDAEPAENGGLPR